MVEHIIILIIYNKIVHAHKERAKLKKSERHCLTELLVFIKYNSI